MTHNFPIYRKSLNGKNWYRINDQNNMTELQQLGSKWLKYEFEAKIYPDFLLLKDMISKNGFEELSPSAFEDLIGLL